MALICYSTLTHDLADIHSVVSLQSPDEYSRPIGWLSEIWMWPFLIYRKRQYILYAQIKNWVSPKYVRSRTRNKSRTISIQFFKRLCLIICYTRMLIIETVSYHWHCGTMAWPLKIALPLRRLQYKSVPTTEKSAGSYHISIKKYINNLHSII